jgi:hypothetical protein
MGTPALDEGEETIVVRASGNRTESSLASRKAMGRSAQATLMLAKTATAKRTRRRSKGSELIERHQCWTTIRGGLEKRKSAAIGRLGHRSAFSKCLI